MKRKLFALVLVVTLFAGMVSSYAEETVDNSQVKYDYSYGDLLFDLGIIIGDGTGDLKEDAYLSRAELAVILTRLSSIRGYDFNTFTAPENPTFSDVGKDHWAYNYVEFLAATKITVGNGKGQFNPGGNVTFGEACLFLSRVWSDYRDINKTAMNMQEAMKTYAECDSNYVMQRKDIFYLMIRTLEHKNAFGKTLYDVKGFKLYGEAGVVKFYEYKAKASYEQVYDLLATDIKYAGISYDSLAKFKNGLATATLTNNAEPIKNVVKEIANPSHNGIVTEIYGSDCDMLNPQVFYTDNFASFLEGAKNSIPIAWGMFNFDVRTYVTSNNTVLYLVIETQSEINFRHKAPYFIIFKTADGKTGLFGQNNNCYYVKDIENFK